MELSPKICMEAAELIQERYSNYLSGNESFEVSGSFSDDKAELRVLLCRKLPYISKTLLAVGSAAHEEAAKIVPEKTDNQSGHEYGGKDYSSSDQKQVSQTVEEFVEFAVRVPLENRINEAEAMELALDAADALTGEWLETGGDQRYSTEFTEYEFAGTKVEAKVLKRRPEIEKAADELLNKYK